VAVHANPDVFLVDEVLAVGDEAFQRKCRSKIGELRSQGKTIVFVSHDLGLVHALCDRVVLLNQGSMILRKTPQATIEYYLRQIGQDTGIHTLESGRSEAVFSHGRLSLFYDQEERTAPTGINAQILSMGQYHDGSSAAWEISERGPAGCMAVGEMSRIPAKLHWKLCFEENALVQTLELEVLRPFSLDHVALYATFPVGYSRYLHGSQAGEFPPVEASQRAAEPIVPIEPGVTSGALEDPESPDRNMHFTIETTHSGGYSYLNSDFMSASRVVQVVARFPQSEMPLEPGRYFLLRFQLHMADTAAAYEAWKAWLASQDSVCAGGLTGRLQRGAIHLSTDAGNVTGSLGAHMQFRCRGMWTLGSYLDWTSAQAKDAAIVAEGVSTRLPFSQEWSLSQGEDGIVLRAWLVCDAAVELEEYNFTVQLEPRFVRWVSEHESGDFPPIPPDQHSWRHVNKDYSTGTVAQGLDIAGNGLQLQLLGECPALHFTALTTGVAQNSHILQWLRSPGQEGVLRFGPGRHLLVAVATRYGASS